MDGVYKELDEVKAEFEKLKEEHRIKTELNQGLVRTHSEQIAKIHEAQSQIERQAKELNAKSEEIDEVRQLYEGIKTRLLETESSLKQVKYAYDKFRIDTGEKMQNMEGENGKLVSALEEATGRNEDLERKLCARSEEIDGLKSLLSDSQRKCLEAEEKARAGRELRQRDDVISSLEEQSMDIQDQLKWKKEQFEHLEDAHKLLQDQFQSSKKEWVSEKSLLLDEILTLQSKLDSQIRIAENLESRLKMCNQALAHEESRRKMLEVQLSESKQCFEDVLAECEEAKARIETLGAKRNEEIAGLRNSLGMKETLMKEMEYRVAHLEQDNKELLETVKELQEAQISKRKTDPSLAKLRNKLKDLEQVHRNCTLTLKEREAKWTSKMGKLIGDMKCHESDLKRQSEELCQIKMQLDDSHNSTEVSGEEISILLMLLKSELSNAYSKLFNSEAQIEACRKETEDRVAAVSAGHLEMKHRSELEAHVCLEQARNEIASLTQKLDSLKAFEEHCTILEKDLEKHKKMLEDSSGSELRLKEQISHMEVALKDVSNALEKSNSQLTVKISEVTQAEMELLVWKSKAENLRTCLEQSEQIFREMETSLREQVEKEQSLKRENDSLQSKSKMQEKKIRDLLQNIASLDQKLVLAEEANKVIKLEVVVAQKKEADYKQIIKLRDVTVENLGKQIQSIEQQCATKESEATESARLEAEKKFKCEKKKLCNIVREKDECISSLQGLASSLEQTFMDMFLLSSTEGLEYLVMSNALEDALKKTHSHMNAEVERKNNAIDLLQIEVSDMRDKAALREESLCHSEKFVKELEGLLEVKKLDIESLVLRFRDEQDKTQSLMNAEIERKNNAIDLLQREVSDMHDKVVLRDDSLFHSEQLVKELEGLLEDKKLEIERLVHRFRDEQAKTHSRMNVEIERKDNELDLLQREVSDMRDKAILQEKSLFRSEQMVKGLEGFLEDKKLEIENLVRQIKDEQDTYYHMNAEIKRKNNAIDLLQREVSDMRDKAVLQEESLFRSEQLVIELEGFLEDKKLEMEDLVTRFRDEQAKLKEQVTDLEQEKEVSIDNIKKLCYERDSLLLYTEEICQQIGEFCTEDTKLQRMLVGVLQNSQEDARCISNVISDTFCEPAQNVFYGTLMRKEVEASIDRSPLREINQ